jgi:hypothetical protein
VASLQGRHACVVAVFLLAAAPFGSRVLISTAVGGALALINLRLLERSVSRLLGTSGAPPNGIALRLFLHLRLGLLFGLVAFVLRSGRVDAISFTVGLSSIVPAVLWHGWQSRET